MFRQLRRQAGFAGSDIACYGYVLDCCTHLICRKIRHGTEKSKPTMLNCLLLNLTKAKGGAQS